MQNPSPPNSLSPWSRRTWALLLLLLALSTILIHGFHPFAEDGGLYAAGIEYTLNPALFPHYTAFVTEHLRFSLFAPVVAILIRVTNLSLPAALLLLAFLSALATMAAAQALLRRCCLNDRAQFAGLALLAAGWTLPIAGTSLYLMDPYVTARSLTMPLSLLAVACALDTWPTISVSKALRHPGLHSAACLLVAAAFHPLMAAYALLFVAALRATRSSRPVLAWAALSTAIAILCLAAHFLSPTESPAEAAAVITRYYWFLSQWQWYEFLGLLGPPVMLALASFAFPNPAAPSACHPERSAKREVEGSEASPHFTRSSDYGSAKALPASRLQALGITAILLAFLATLIALLFAHESSATHTVARLQPLREFLLLYAVMLLLLGAAISEACHRAAVKTRGVSRLALQATPALFTVAMAAGLFLAARATYPASLHIEFPWRTTQQQNPWAQAFLWARDNTPPDALFALDARYINTPGEDAQAFRAISLRSAMPDFSKDGGEASITPAIAPTWLAAAQAQADMSALSDTERDHRLAPFAPSWMVLHADAETAHLCPYSNGIVKVCRF